MGYDLARLRLNGLIERLDGTNTYILTDDGQRVAIFYTKVHDQLLRPLLAADRPPAPLTSATPSNASTTTSATSPTTPTSKPPKTQAGAAEPGDQSPPDSCSMRPSPNRPPKPPPSTPPPRTSRFASSAATTAKTSPQPIAYLDGVPYCWTRFTTTPNYCGSVYAGIAMHIALAPYIAGITGRAFRR